jgi:hypothetical protein
MTEPMVEVSLTLDEYEMLLVALGFATASARMQNDQRLFANLIRIVNAVGRSSPGRFVPYEVPGE